MEKEILKLWKIGKSPYEMSLILNVSVQVIEQIIKQNENEFRKAKMQRQVI